jgi:hypothetical protein
MIIELMGWDFMMGIMPYGNYILCTFGFQRSIQNVAGFR